jgi:hypothetical protein
MYCHSIFSLNEFSNIFNKLIHCTVFCLVPEVKWLAHHQGQLGYQDTVLLSWIPILHCHQTSKLKKKKCKNSKWCSRIKQYHIPSTQYVSILLPSLWNNNFTERYILRSSGNFSFPNHDALWRYEWQYFLSTPSSRNKLLDEITKAKALYNAFKHLNISRSWVRHLPQQVCHKNCITFFIDIINQYRISKIYLIKEISWL